MGSLAEAAGRGYIGVPTSPQDRADWERLVSHVINLTLLQGKSNSTASATLRNGFTTTTLSDTRVTATSVIVPMALTANAATALATWHVAAATLIEGSFVITHALTSTADCDIYYAILG